MAHLNGLSKDTSHGTDSNKYLYLAGINVGHSIAWAMHNRIAERLGLPWSFQNKECPTAEDAMALFRKTDFAGAVVTMPFKKAIMAHLDALDDLAILVGACNNVYFGGPPTQELRGTNTDWIGVRDCLRNTSQAGIGKPALIVGAGGASQAAVYALSVHLQCTPIYVVNRDAEEVHNLVESVQCYSQFSLPIPEIVHVLTMKQAESIRMPFYIVGTVPDLEPTSTEEILSRDIVNVILSRITDQGVLLDMCFKPRRTRLLKMGVTYSWTTVEGVDVIGYQARDQWRLWTGEELASKIPEDELWQVLRTAAEKSPDINF